MSEVSSKKGKIFLCPAWAPLCEPTYLWWKCGERLFFCSLCKTLHLWAINHWHMGWFLYVCRGFSSKKKMREMFRIQQKPYRCHNTLEVMVHVDDTIHWSSGSHPTTKKILSNTSSRNMRSTIKHIWWGTYAPIKTTRTTLSLFLLHQSYHVDTSASVSCSVCLVIHQKTSISKSRTHRVLQRHLSKKYDVKCPKPVSIRLRISPLDSNGAAIIEQ